jgi:aminoglycoside phosphotransferase (APT) family kinase protein
MPRATGYSNETIFFRAAWSEQGRPREGHYVARIEPNETPIYPRQTALPLASVDVQYRTMQTVAEHSTVRVAPLVGYEVDRAVLGRPFFVMAYVDGRVPADWPRYTQEGFVVEEATPAERRRLLESGLEAMAQIHRIDCGKAGLEWLVPPGKTPGLRCQLEVYREDASRELRGRRHPILEQALDWLESHFPGEGDVGISWGDARIGNMIFADYECVAVTDWEAVALGPPELDLGWWLMYDRFMHESAGVTTRLEGMPTRDEQRAYYAALTGRRLGDMHYFEVCAAMRFTAVMLRTMERMTNAGLVPVEMNGSIHNVATQVLADLLGIPYNWTDPPK